MDWTRMRRISVSLLFANALLTGPALIADPIEPWQGASAEVLAVGQQSSEHGINADASASGKTFFHFSEVLKVEARGSARAQVLGTPEALLRVNTSVSVDPPGRHTGGYYSDVDTLTTAQASWMGDRIHLEPNANGTMPNSIRLGVMLTLGNPWYNVDFLNPGGDPLHLQLGDRHFLLRNGIPGGSYGQIVASASLLGQPGFDTVTQVTDPDHPGLFQAKAFLNLAVDDQGWSTPFDLSLKSRLGSYPLTTQKMDISLGDFTLSLDDITLSDGTSVTDAGYAVTFDSGLAWRQPVPEPASIAGWIVLVTVTGVFSRRRARRAVVVGD